ncbi:ATP-binding cassette domain-containing protein [Sneathiella sp. P13V-1]|uniref:ATP-binding cassette domain-containing protein n=1 Tax=Sneathiella sp. P13V-1 TaxID=2697366 RepID=UPI00187BB628|nr:ATP-binding cassette domain-containing protein [Sneathiella sp. P13V-1]MBE7636600.1 ATP-binding cassette domain-containing protein [Sneathiella sp. P13V-1]
MLKATDISLSLSGKQILKNISLQAQQREITAILGPNGAGKSTLMKCLAGFQKPDTGKIEIADKVIGDLSGGELAKQRAVLTQHVSIGFPIKGVDVVALGRAAYRNEDISEQNEIIREVMALTGTTEFAERQLDTLSGGEAQRLHLSRVLAQLWGQRNAVLFLDEPTSALDLKYQFQLFDLCSSLCENLNFAIVAILHDLNLARKMTNKTILLKEGGLYRAGDSREIINSNSVCDLYEITEEQFNSL